MSNPESNLHTALMARVEAMLAALSYPALWPQKGGDMPAGEHVRIYQLSNDNQAADLSSDVMERQGFLIITLVSPLGVYEAVTKRKAGEIASYFPRTGGSSLSITGHTVKPGRQDGQRWETPIWISYWSMT